MNPESLLGLLAGALSALVASAALISGKSLRETLAGRALPKTYSERLSDLTSSLTKASSEVDAVLQEMKRVALEREKSVASLESGLAELESKERELKESISALQNVPIPVAAYFAKLVEPGERRSARRDYLLFTSGVVVTTIVTILMQLAIGK
jgi:hypothetical protein